MSNPKVLLLQLRERTSASGNLYLSGWLGKASVVGFLDRDSEDKVWNVYLQEPDPKPGEDRQSSRRRQVSTGGATSWQRDIPPQPARNGRGRPTIRAAELDDDISDIGR